MSQRKQTTCSGNISCYWTTTYVSCCLILLKPSTFLPMFTNIHTFSLITVALFPSKTYEVHTPKVAHQTLILGLWSGRWWNSRESPVQYPQFCLLTSPEKWRTPISNELFNEESEVIPRPSHSWTWHEYARQMIYPSLRCQSIAVARRFPN